MVDPNSETKGFSPIAAGAEESVLGSVLVNPATYLEVAAFLKADDFYILRHRWIWEAFTRLQEAKLAIDIVTVSDDLAQHDQLELAGGGDYLVKLITDVPTSIHAESYGQIVLRAATARRTVEASKQIAALASEPDLSAEEIVGQAQTVTAKLAEGLTTTSAAIPVGQVADSYVDELKERQEHPENFKGVLSGLVDLDQILGGFRATRLNILAGRPGSGKTSGMLTIALNAAQAGKHVLIFSLEMDVAEIGERLISMLSGVSSEILNRAATVSSDWPKIEEAKLKMHSLPIYIDDTAAVSPAIIRAKIAKHKMVLGSLDLVIVDYLQLMQGDMGRKWNNRVEEVSFVSRQLKLIAREFKVPVLAGAQLSRAVEQRQDKRPMLSDLRESGSIEQDSDVVIFSHQPTASENIFEWIVAKQRQGPTGSLSLYFRKELTRFYNAESHVISLP